MVMFRDEILLALNKVNIYSISSPTTGTLLFKWRRNRELRGKSKPDGKNRVSVDV